ncbi:MAG: hypothetical protein J7M08_07270 [Planctomycetes bacterium]|nr:hypothetical protein [Planctomycetota bacterium]
MEKEEARPAPGPRQRSDDSETISTARKVRLGILLAILLIVTVAFFAARAHRERLKEQAARDSAEAVQQARSSLRDMDWKKAASYLNRAVELDPSNQDVARMGIELELVPSTLSVPRHPSNQDVARMGIELAFAVGALNEAFSRFNQMDLSVGEIHAAGHQFVRRCGLLWNMAHRITQPAHNDREKALLLCRWFALYLLPVAEDGTPDPPISVLQKGFGERKELVWTYVALARQAGLLAKVFVPGGPAAPYPLVQVYPADSAPFLVDPCQGTPLLNPRTGDYLCADDTAEWQRLLLPPGPAPKAPQEASAGEPAGPHTQLWPATHPGSLDPRMQAFENLLGDLPFHPVLFFNARLEQVHSAQELWPVPKQILRRRNSPEAAQAVTKQRELLQLAGSGRDAYLLGKFNEAQKMNVNTLNTATSALEETDSPQAAPLIKKAIEAASFYALVTAHEAGNLEEAAQRATSYLERYPDGRWAPLAKLLRAEIASQQGDEETARALWRDLPQQRRLYGTMRADGLLPAP